MDGENGLDYVIPLFSPLKRLLNGRCFTNTDYLEKLKDPRWQKKRLEIFERDKWKCALCNDKENTLVIHHKLYITETEPWDYPNDYMVTLCETCHDFESQCRSQFERQLIDILRLKFPAFDLVNIMSGFEHLSSDKGSHIISEAYEWALSSPDICNKLISMYLEAHNGKG
jgi:hypothetical protein